MEVLSPSKKHTQALEMVSEEEEEDESALLESEHEEGEICSEEDDEVLVDEGEGVSCAVFQSSNYDNSLTSYPTHFSSFQGEGNTNILTLLWSPLVMHSNKANMGLVGILYSIRIGY